MHRETGPGLSEAFNLISEDSVEASVILRCYHVSEEQRITVSRTAMQSDNYNNRTLIDYILNAISIM